MNNSINAFHAFLQRHYIQHIAFYPVYLLPDMGRNKKRQLRRGTAQGTNTESFFDKALDNVGTQKASAAGDENSPCPLKGRLRSLLFCFSSVMI
jgi:hypothetical protein